MSFQLPCEEDVLQSAFEDKPLCVPRQLAELLQLSVEEVCADFDAVLRHDWRRLGISAEEVREFCVWRNAPMRVCRPSESGGALTPRTCSRACSGARTCARRGASLWPLARAPRWPSAARRSTAG